MAKTKATPWEGKKKMFKDGNPDVFRGFNWETWKHMTDPERAMWTEFSEVARAPIPKEVIDFKEKTKIAGLNHVRAEEVLNESIDKQNEETEKEAIKTKLKELGIRFTHNSKLETLKKKLADALDSE